MQTTRKPTHPSHPPRWRGARGVSGLAALATFFVASAGLADVPTLGGLMNHVNIGVVPTAPGSATPWQLVAHIDDPQPGGMLMADTASNLDAPYDILNHKNYNAQYGWLRSGRWGLTNDEVFYIERLSQTDGLETYEGGLGVDSGGTGNTSGGHSLAPIFGTDNAQNRWAWDLTMAHNWYATTVPGALQATYNLYVENTTTGQLSPTFAPATLTLDFTNNAATLIGDFNNSGQVEQSDLDLVLQNWGNDTDATGIPAGWTNDNSQLGQIEQTELDKVLQHWGSTHAPDFSGNAVPEPTALTLLMLSSVTMRRRQTQRCRA